MGIELLSLIVVVVAMLQAFNLGPGSVASEHGLRLLKRVFFAMYRALVATFGFVIGVIRLIYGRIRPQQREWRW